jgi:hypothetical protein
MKLDHICDISSQKMSALVPACVADHFHSVLMNTGPEPLTIKQFMDAMESYITEKVCIILICDNVLNAVVCNRLKMQLPIRNLPSSLKTAKV